MFRVLGFANWAPKQKLRFRVLGFANKVLRLRV